MRRFLLAAALLVALGVPGSSVSARSSGINWALMVVTAGPHGASDVQFTAEVSGPGNGEQVIMGDLNAEYNPSNQDHPYISCSILIPVGGALSTHLEMQQSGPIARLVPGQRLAVLMFFADGEVRHVRFNAVARSGRVDVLRTYGEGARGIYVKDGRPTTTSPLGLAFG
ncbi:MAG TPA: hypothetical protein VFQ37_10420, partial [Mycobacterium sp.]|nr:hypothetical protein [Mycobacterium sp.]